MYNSINYLLGIDAYNNVKKLNMEQNGKIAFAFTLYAIITFFVGCIVGAYNVKSKTVKTEYFLEVSEDSIWVESQSGKVYQGKYIDLDSLICIDNI